MMVTVKAKYILALSESYLICVSSMYLSFVYSFHPTPSLFITHSYSCIVNLRMDNWLYSHCLTRYDVAKSRE